MASLDDLIQQAENELTQYSTDGRKVQKLRRKFAFTVPKAQSEQFREQLRQELEDSWVTRLVERQRQAVALPFWGIAGLGLLLGISMNQPRDFAATVVGGGLAILLQRWGWQLQARRLVFEALGDTDPTTLDSTDE
jgi:hypothetical protein